MSDQEPFIDPGDGRVRCVSCVHFRPDPMGGGGIGECVINAHIRRPNSPLLYPRALRICEEREAIRTNDG